MYEKGRGVAQSDEKAVEWVTKAAEQGQREYNGFSPRLPQSSVQLAARHKQRGPRQPRSPRRATQSLASPANVSASGDAARGGEGARVAAEQRVT